MAVTPLESYFDHEDLVLPVLEPCLSEVDQPVLTKERCHSRHVQIDSLRPVRESLEQVLVKEVETMWLDEAQIIKDLTKRAKTLAKKQMAAAIKKK